MPVLSANGVELHYREAGTGEPVLFIAGTGASGRTWHLHQAPALTGAGYRVLTFDHRGIGASTLPPGPMRLTDLVADTAALISATAGPCRVVGSSMGAQVAAELAVANPDLVTQLVLMAMRSRPDAMSRALSAAERELHDSGVKLPAAYDAVIRAHQNLSPATLADDQEVTDWLEIFELSSGFSGSGANPGERAQLDLEVTTDRRPDYARIAAPALVIGFADDLICPPALGRETAQAIPGARYAEVAGAGHYGYLERPQQVNQLLLDFFATDR